MSFHVVIFVSEDNNRHYSRVAQ